MAGTLANGGVCPITGERVSSQPRVIRILMYKDNLLFNEKTMEIKVDILFNV